MHYTNFFVSFPYSRSEFLRDMELIYSNSKEFNGEQSEFTLKAKVLVDITKEKLYQAYTDDMARYFLTFIIKLALLWMKNNLLLRGKYF